MIPPLFLLTDRRLMPDLVARAEHALARLPEGSAAIVLREKDLPVRALLSLARQLRETTRGRARLIVSGRLDVALASGADGVHCGGEAPSAAATRTHAGGLLVGTSLHGDETAEQQADYAFLSPIFATRSKPGVTPLGLEKLHAAAAVSRVPLVALGGIGPDEARKCFEAGASAVACRESWLVGGDDVLAAWAESVRYSSSARSSRIVFSSAAGNS